MTMTELVFTEKVAVGEKFWEAVAMVENDFNVRVERGGRGALWIGVSTVEGGTYSELYFGAEGKVFDRDFDLQVYPKYVCVRSFSEPISGVVNDTPEKGGSGSGGSEEVVTPEKLQDMVMTAEDVEDIRSLIK